MSRLRFKVLNHLHNNLAAAANNMVNVVNLLKMTTITLNQDAIKVNGRTIYDTVKVANIAKVSGGVWAGQTSKGDTFRIIGGFASGGGRNEWFLEYPFSMDFDVLDDVHQY